MGRYSRGAEGGAGLDLDGVTNLNIIKQTKTILYYCIYSATKKNTHTHTSIQYIVLLYIFFHGNI